MNIDNLTVHAEKDTHTIRIGEAIKEEAPVKPLVTKIAGRIDAPMIYLRAKKDLIEQINTLVLVSVENSTITFMTNETSPYGHQISGSLKDNKQLSEFKINVTGGFFTDKSLAKLLRKYSFLFDDRSDVEKLYKDLMSFSAKVDTVIQNKKDTQGNASVGFEKIVKTSIQETITFNCPLFEGGNNHKFVAYICCEATSSGVEFYLDSPDLFRIKEAERLELLNANLEPFVDFGTAIIHV
jgi:hypothetical protein